MIDFFWRRFFEREDFIADAVESCAMLSPRPESVNTVFGGVKVKGSYCVRTFPACLGFVRLLLARADEALDCNRGFLSLSLLEIVHPTADGRNHIGWRLAFVLTGRTAVRLGQDALFTLDYFYNSLL